MNGGLRAAVVALLASAVWTAGLIQPIAQSTSLTGGLQVARTYDAIMDADFSAVPRLLLDTCPPAPREVCQLLAVISSWWQIQVDPHNRGQDDVFRTNVDVAIGAVQRWTEREPGRAEAWFYLGGAIGARAQWRVLRGQTLSAARDGKRIKSSLERALMLDPTLHDAYFGIGMYHYYAAVAPRAARMLRWLLLLPGGDREQGLEEMLRARAAGQLLRSEADYQLQIVYLWNEKQPRRALELATALSERHPHNPHFLQHIAEIEDGYTLDHVASLRAWQTLLDRARRGQVAMTEMARTRAELGVALELDHTGQPEAAIPILRGVIESKPTTPVGAEALAQLQLGQVYDQLAQHERAATSYRAALAANPAGDPLKIASRARAGLRASQR